MNAERQIELESRIRSAEYDIVFYDRGMYDYAAMCILRNIEVPQRILDLAKSCHYDLVFVFDTLSDFRQRPETGRMLTKELSLRLRDLAKGIYEEHGHKTIFVKEMPFNERIEFVKGYL